MFAQNIPQFLPVMRGTVSLPANRDPEVLERLQPDHLKNMCNRMQVHLNASATQVAANQTHISVKLKEASDLEKWKRKKKKGIQVHLELILIDFSNLGWLRNNKSI